MSPSRFRTIEVADERFTHDGLLPITFKSPALRARADMTLFVPDGLTDSKRASSRDPIVILLHGVYGSHWAWALKGGVHRTAARLIAEGAIPPMVLAMPSDGLWGDGSGYLRHGLPTPAASAADFERYIVEDVPDCVVEVLGEKTGGRIAADSPLFITGLSMGGFGALRIGAKYAGRFAGISGHSSITHFSQMSRFVEEPLTTYGDIPASEQSVLAAIESNRDKLPPLRFDCGTADDLLEANRELHGALEAQKIPHTYTEHPGGHEWPYWERHIADTLRFFARVVDARV